MRSPSLWTPGRFDRPEFGEFGYFTVHVTCACGAEVTLELSGADTPEGRQERERLMTAHVLALGWWAEEGEHRCPECRGRRLAEGTGSGATFAAKMAGATPEGAVIGGTLCILAAPGELPSNMAAVGVRWSDCLGSEECPCAECEDGRRK